MVLVDTTVWIDLLRGRGSPPVMTLRQLLTDGQAVTAPVILQEVLQGASGPDSLQRLRDHFLSLSMVEPAAGGLTHAAAGELYARCRWQGITPRSPHDCLIAQLAIEHDIPLLHDDRGFEALARVDGRLRLMAVAAAP